MLTKNGIEDIVWDIKFGLSISEEVKKRLWTQSKNVYQIISKDLQNFNALIG